MGARVGDRVWGWCFYMFLLIWLFVLAKLWLCQHIFLVEGQQQPDWSASLPEIAQMHYCISWAKKTVQVQWFSVPLRLCNVCILCWKTPNSQHLWLWHSHLVIASGPSASIFPCEVMSGWTPHARGKCVAMPWATAVSAAWWFVWPVPQIAVAWSKSLPVWGVVWRILYFLLKNRGYSNNRLCWEIQEG